MFDNVHGFFCSRSSMSLKRKLRYELLEDKRMLAAMADVVFLVDESASDVSTQSWIKNELVDRMEDVSFLKSLENKGIQNIEFGLVGFGDAGNPNANSLVVDSTSSNSLFGDSTEFKSAMFSLGNTGDEDEDGWDAIEHVIAEYDFRDGTVPVLVLVQNLEGRNWVNETLTHSGILASMESKNILLNVLTGGSGDSSSTLSPIFDLTSYEVNSNEFNNLRILGLEADQVDNVTDGLHDIHIVDNMGTTVANPPASQSEALQISHKGSNTGATGMVGTVKVFSSVNS